MWVACLPSMMLEPFGGVHLGPISPSEYILGVLRKSTPTKYDDNTIRFRHRNIFNTPALRTLRATGAHAYIFSCRGHAVTIFFRI